MLTKNDLEQIRKVIREEVENEAQSIKDELSSDIAMSGMRMRESLDEVKNRIKNLEIRMTKMHKELKEEIKLVANFLDKENVSTNRRVKKIETRLGMSSL